jgi:hypothetical protein
MKILTIISLLFCVNVFAKSAENKKANLLPTPTPTASGLPDVVKGEAPCDKKEDVLKKIEEEKKKLKAFSLQGGNSGCSVNELKK